jgi:hypothetical protein
LAAALAPENVICSQINLGYGGGNNLGIARALAAGKEYILLLNADAQISETAVRALVERMEANPGISILGPVIHESRDGLSHCLIGGRDIARHLSTRIAQCRDLTSISGYPLHAVDYVSGTVFLARSKMFQEVGLLDEQYFFSGEIADFCKRARNRAHKAYVDLAVEARHDPGQTAPQLRDTLYAYYNLRNRFLYVRKHHASERMKYFLRWTLAGGLQLARAVARWNMPKARAILLALAHAYGRRYGDQNARFIHSID